MSEMTLLEKDEDIEKATRALKAMAHPLRLKILCALKDSELPVLEIVEQVALHNRTFHSILIFLELKTLLNLGVMVTKFYAKLKILKF